MRGRALIVVAAVAHAALAAPADGTGGAALEPRAELERRAFREFAGKGFGRIRVAQTTDDRPLGWGQFGEVVRTRHTGRHALRMRPRPRRGRLCVLPLFVPSFPPFF